MKKLLFALALLGANILNGQPVANLNLLNKQKAIYWNSAKEKWEYYFGPDTLPPFKTENPDTTFSVTLRDTLPYSVLTKKSTAIPEDYYCDYFHKAFILTDNERYFSKITYNEILWYIYPQWTNFKSKPLVLEDEVAEWSNVICPTYLEWEGKLNDMCEHRFYTMEYPFNEEIVFNLNFALLSLPPFIQYRFCTKCKKEQFRKITFNYCTTWHVRKKNKYEIERDKYLKN